jgi:Protein of unknown function (DUF3347)
MDIKKILDILAIVLPFILIVFAFLRVDGNESKKTSPRIKALNGFTLLIAVLLLLIGGIKYLMPPEIKYVNSGEKPTAMAVSKHSDLFNNSVSSVLTAYYNMTEGFVNWDTILVNKYANEMKTALDNVKLEELKVDTTGIYESALDPVANAKTEVGNILSNPSIGAKRTSLNSLSENLRLLFIVVKYDREKLYWQECPMAFGDDQRGNWLSKTKAVRNPYLGTKHPEYKAGMLECGEPKDTINFIPVAPAPKAK